MLLKERWFKTYNLQNPIHPTTHSLPIPTAEEVLLRFWLRWLWYSDCFEHQCNVVERISDLYQGSPAIRFEEL